MQDIKINKGDTFFMLSNWDRKGTYIYREVEVTSAGKKRATLIDVVTGEKLGNHFKPYHNELYVYDTEAATQVKGLLLADAGYRRSMQKDVDALHDARCISYNQACTELRNKRG